MSYRTYKNPWRAPTTLYPANLPAPGMLTPTTYLGNAGVFCILTIHAAVFTISLSTALAHTMRTFLVLSHLSSPLFLDEFECLNGRTCGSDGQTGWVLWSAINPVEPLAFYIFAYTVYPTGFAQSRIE